MNTERFISLIDAYGAEPRRWPESERDAALTLARENEAAGAHWRAAASLDRVLDEAGVRGPSAALRQRVLGFAPRPRPAYRRVSWWAPGASLAAAGVAGLMIGAALFDGPFDMNTQAVFAEAEPYDETVIEEFSAGTEGRL